jgi:citronellol/citronellal dehydrogenase
MPTMTYRSVFRPGLFAGQTVIVTGAGSGIGRCCAHELAALGAHVVLLGRSTAKLQAVEAEIRADGGEATLLRHSGRGRASAVTGIVAGRRIHGLSTRGSPRRSGHLQGLAGGLTTNLTGGLGARLRPVLGARWRDRQHARRHGTAYRA